MQPSVVHEQSGPIQLGANVTLLDEERFVFDAMLVGWGQQQTSRGLSRQSIVVRERLVRRFGEFCGTYPWQWVPDDLEAFCTQLMSEPTRAAKSTIRSYQMMIRLFCAFVTDGRYGWGPECDRRFGQTPSQICFEWNTLAHLADYEGNPAKRALTYDELQRFFDVADARVERIQRAGRKGALAAARDAQLLKTIYAYGLRRTEAVSLDVADLRSNSKAPLFGNVGAVYVRWGKGSRGTGPKRRTVLTVPEVGWIVGGIEHWLAEGRPHYTEDPTGPLWPTERGTRVSAAYLAIRFAEIREAAGLPQELTLHSLRHSYVTCLLEWGYVERFVQDQVGHAYASTTAIYSSVGDDFKNRTLVAALERFYNEGGRDGGD